MDRGLIAKTLSLLCGLLLVVLLFWIIFGETQEISLIILAGSALLSGILSFVLFFKDRTNNLREIDKLEQTRKDLLDYLEASWQSNQKIITEEKYKGLHHLLVGFAHEINTPLGNTVTTLSYLGDYLKSLDPKDDTIAESVKIALESLGKVNQMIERILQMASVHHTEGIEEISLREVMKDLEALKNLGPDSPQLVVELKDNEELSIRTTRPAILSLLAPFLDNALESNGNHSSVVRVSFQKNGAGLVINVKDQGHGIDPEHLPFIFDPFFTTQRGKKKLGLGLSIAHSIVKRQFGGDIEVHSEPGAGTRFEIRLPNILAPEKVSSPHSPDSSVEKSL